MSSTRPIMTAVETILLAAYRMSGGYEIEASIPESDLIVAAWQLDKDRFGLRGFRNKHPDAKRVACELSLSKPYSVIGRKWLERIAPLMYRITLIGIQKAKELELQFMKQAS